jgi:hypothetical protein
MRNFYSDFLFLELGFIDILKKMQVRLDIATVVGLLAYIVNYKFESLGSP